MIQSPERARVYAIFVRALGVQGTARDSLIVEECGGALEIQQHVRRLLALAEESSTSALLEPERRSSDARIGSVFGAFRLVEALGTGGMGSVYRGERHDGVQQTVAVKVLHQPVGHSESQHFLREAKILARLEHPAIARLVDVGIRDKEAWFAMEFVRGLTIVDYCDTHRLGVRERVQLLIAVADAVLTAHRMLVVHRDLKPTNVLVTDDGQPKLIDFGIASALRDSGDSQEPTTDLRMWFTPHYSAPEQVAGKPVTVATDVFGLGALAYRLLTGCAPHSGATSPVGYLVTVTSQDAEVPSQAAHRSGRDSATAGKLRGDLDAILMKALERDPARRYGTVQELRADLDAYLTGMPVRARPFSVSYRARKFVQRHKLAVALTASLLVTGPIGAGIFTMQERRVTRALESAARRDAFLEQVIKSANPSSGRRDITVAELLDTAQRSLDQSLAGEPLVEASMLGLIVDTNASLGRYAPGISASDRQLALLRASGGGNLEMAKALFARGQLLCVHGNYTDALPLLRQAVKLFESQGHDDLDMANALNELGVALANTNHYGEAEQLYRRAAALDLRLDREHQGEAGVTLQNLSVLMANQNRFPEAAQLAKQAWEVFEAHRPPDHPDLLTAEATYAMAVLNLHEPAKAEPILRDVVARSVRVRGPEHPDTLIGNIQLGEVLLDLKRFEEAEKILKPTARSLDRVEGSDTRFATGAWSDFAVAACSGNDPAGGLEAAQRVDRIRQRTLPQDDRHRAATQVNLGFCLVRLHRYVEAEPLLLQAVAVLEPSRGRDFYLTQEAYGALRDLYRARNDSAAAQRMASKLNP